VLLRLFCNFDNRYCCTPFVYRNGTEYIDVMSFNIGLLGSVYELIHMGCVDQRMFLSELDSSKQEIKIKL
jgi:hypothetical protein